MEIQPTPFLRGPEDGLEQLVRVVAAGTGLILRVDSPAGSRDWMLGDDKDVHSVYLAVRDEPMDVTFTLRGPGGELARETWQWQPPRRWVVHVCQVSHHDVGYTDLASHVVPEHDRWLDAAIDLAAATRDWPADARFRIVVEQAWSIDHFLRHAPAPRRAAMLELLRAGDVELTALFGNLTTELCGHETLARAVYPAFRIAREHGIPIVSAEHNDVPGFTWGLSQVLTEAGIEIFCPDLPGYYQWGGNAAAPSFWDDRAIFGGNLPGAFWWEAPGGKRVLFYRAVGGGCDPALPGLADRLMALAAGGYPFRTLRWSVKGGARDNSPYIGGFAETIRTWNEQWTYPHLVSSTNARFYRDLRAELPADLPVRHGGVPGQDYPPGAASTAAATAVNRRNHTDLPVAETLATVAAAWTDFAYPAERLDRAQEEVVRHDEHTWGHHFPAGPTAATAELEKAVHAHRAATLAHDVTSRALARLADAVALPEPGLHLVVFNPLPRVRDALVRTSLREIDNCGSVMAPTPQGILRGYLLGDRWHVTPPPEIAAGHFDLVDVVTGNTVPYQVVEHDSPLGPEPCAAARLGLSAGGKRYGIFEVPNGLRCDLLFQARNLPALGYRTYRLAPRKAAARFPVVLEAGATRIENDHYRLEIDRRTGFVRRLLDKASGRELVDAEAPHPFGAVLVRGPQGSPRRATGAAVEPGRAGPVCASLRVRHRAWGLPEVETTYTLYADEPRLDIAVGLLKDAEPLLETYLAFPFALPHATPRLSVPLATVDPGADRLPGAYADRLTVQDWVRLEEEDFALTWASLDAPVVSVGRLWPGRVSPAHSAVVRPDLEHPCQTAADLRGGHLYSLLTANNFGTNFAVSQSGALLCRFRLTTGAAELDTPLPTIFTEGGRAPGTRPPAAAFLELDDPRVRLVTLKHAEDGRGSVARLRNTAAAPVTTTVTIPALVLTAAFTTTLAEVDTGPLPCTSHAIDLTFAPHQVRTLRLLAEPADSE